MDVEFLRHRYRDGHDGVVVEHKFKIGVRHIQVVYMVVCSAVLGAMRGSACQALIAATDVNRRNDTYIVIHDWDSRVQGRIMSSFFLGYALMLLPAELYLKRVGGKFLLTAVLLLNGAITVAMPTITNRGGALAVYNAYLLLGMTQSCLSPANEALISRWLPPNERKLFSSLIHFGVHLGLIISLPLSGLIAEARLGWELVFYSQAMMTLSMAAVWGLLTASTPDGHQAVGDAEKEYIRETLNSYRKKVQQVPWSRILRCRRFWAASSMHAASNAVFVFYLTYVPVYIHTFKPSLRDTGWQAMLPLVGMWMLHATTAPTIEWLCRFLQFGFHFNITYFRKLVNALGACGVIAGLTLLPNLPEWNLSTVTTLVGTLALLGFQLSGFLETYKDMSQNYPGSLLTLSRMVASVVGAFVPLVTGLILGDNPLSRDRWRVVFLTLGSLYVVSSLVFTTLATCTRQPWDGGEVVKNKFGYHNEIITDNSPLELEEFNKQRSNQTYENDIDSS